MGRWIRFVQMAVYVARYAKQQRGEIRAMPLSDFFAWHHAVSDMIRREGESNDE